MSRRSSPRPPRPPGPARGSGYRPCRGRRSDTTVGERPPASAAERSERSSGRGRKPQPIVVALGPVDPAVVEPILGEHAALVIDPGPADIAVAVGAIARADAVIDAAFLDRARRVRVIARTGVGVDRVDVEAATARGIPVVILPGSGRRAG